MQLEFQRAHLSITSFPTCIIPDFTIITGLNGAGKSHLLQALARGDIATDVAPGGVAGQEIRLYDWSTLVPNDSGPFSSDTLAQEKRNILNQFNTLLLDSMLLRTLGNVARVLGLPTEYAQNVRRLIELDQSGLIEIVGADRARESRDLIEKAVEEASSTAISRVDQNAKQVILALSRIKKCPALRLSLSDFESTDIINWGHVDLFQQSLGRLFIGYRDARLKNELAEFRSFKGRAHDQFIFPDDFVEKFGPQPWDLVNEIMKQSGLDFAVNGPALDCYDSYTPQLTKISSGLTVPFSSLSSGEKILISFAFCVYHADDRYSLSGYPKLLLFDEIDALLHPSMTKSLLRTITDTLVKKLGIKVIAVTHSPSTVALAPDDSIYVMTPYQPGLRSVSKSEALNLLTAGVPTVAISYDGRRQVFVESPTDAKVLYGLYGLLKSQILSERSLEFISTGMRSKEGDVNTGCEVVKRFVHSMAEAGNQSIFGLIDSDGKHTSSERIMVLGQGARDGVENFVLDPLILVAVVCRDCPHDKETIGIEAKLPWPEFMKMGPETLQGYVDKLTAKIFDSTASNVQKVSYCGGFDLNLDERWLKTDDHRLEDKVISKLPFLGSISKGRPDQLKLHIIDTVLNDQPGFIPTEIKDTFVKLLEQPSH
ncbi:ATP-dependent nuclease [Methylovirgula sp. 4M-Z18]|uniref:ATP-dependent nuclease n=1 Tax=Methylovirgula sp. 4M-Z18 TaxID=2293567 RepID=UPI001314B82A|nr:ATP-binding protein [Methylovirgula sp. 4M-Z18]